VTSSPAAPTAGQASGRASAGPTTDRAPARVRERTARLLRDPLTRNSLYLMLTTGTMALAGLLFWLVVARLAVQAEVGRASTLISALTTLTYFSLAGMNSTLMRHLAGAADRGRLVSTATWTVVGLGALLAAGYVVLLPALAPELGFVHDDPAVAVAFVVLATGAALNLLTDSVFVAVRAAGWNLLLDGVLLGVVKLALPVLLVGLLGLGAFGVFASSAAASTVAAVASLVVVHRRLAMRLRPRVDGALLRETWSYSAANYVGNCLNLVPVLAMPLALLRLDGADATAAFFVAFQIVTILNSGSYAVCEAMLAEGAHDPGALRRTARRAAVVMTAVTLPGAAVLVAVAGPALHLFGGGYRADATTSLVVLALGSLAVAFYSWGNYLLKLTGQLHAIVWTNVVYAVSIVGLAVLLAPHGPTGVAWAWGAGNLAAGAVAVGTLARHLRAGRRDPAAGGGA